MYYSTYYDTLDDYPELVDYAIEVGIIDSAKYYSKKAMNSALEAIDKVINELALQLDGLVAKIKLELKPIASKMPVVWMAIRDIGHTLYASHNRRKFEIARTERYSKDFISDMKNIIKRLHEHFPIAFDTGDITKLDKDLKDLQIDVDATASIIYSLRKSRNSEASPSLLTNKEKTEVRLDRIKYIEEEKRTNKVLKTILFLTEKYVEMRSDFGGAYGRRITDISVEIVATLYYCIHVFYELIKMARELVIEA